MGIYVTPARDASVLDLPPPPLAGSGGDWVSSPAILFARTAELHDRGHDAVWREVITNSLRELANGERSINQRAFWALFASLQRSEINLSDLASALDFDRPIQRSVTSVRINPSCGTRPFLTGVHLPQSAKLTDARWAAFKENSHIQWAEIDENLIVIDGQHRLCALSKATLDVSERLIKRAIRHTLIEIESSQDIDCFGRFLGLLGSSLSRVITDKAQISVYYFYEPPRESNAENTRDSVMKFRIHTGNPPPACCRVWPAVSWLQVTNNAERKNYEQVQKSKGARCLRKSLRARRTRSRLYQRSRNDPRTHRCVHFTRCRGPWPYRLLGKSTGTVRSWPQREMACFISVER